MDMSDFNKVVSLKEDELKQANAPAFSVIEQFEKKLSESEAFQKALRKGSKIPVFSLPNSRGELINIQDLHKDKFLVLVFYRGLWCPFCNLQLKSMQHYLDRISGSPANLVAISPQLPDHSANAIKTLNISFEVLSDIDNKVGKLFNLVYTLPAYLNEAYKEYGISIQHHNGQGAMELPFPATYVINQKGIIVKEYIGASLSDRVDPLELIELLKSLSA